MGTFELFDHTADLGLRIRDSDLSGLFETAARGLFATVVANLENVRPEVEETIELRAENTEELLALWLNELIFRCETRHRIYCEFAVQLDGPGQALRATIRGESMDRDRHALDHEVKAATRHGLHLESTQDGWMAEVILDI